MQRNLLVLDAMRKVSFFIRKLDLQIKDSVIATSLESPGNLIEQISVKFILEG